MYLQRRLRVVQFGGGGGGGGKASQIDTHKLDNRMNNVILYYYKYKKQLNKIEK